MNFDSNASSQDWLENFESDLQKIVKRDWILTQSSCENPLRVDYAPSESSQIGVNLLDIFDSASN